MAARTMSSYVPSMSDDAVREKTQRTWAEWFAALDGRGAALLDHRGIVRVLSDEFGVPRWWRQMIAVEYERARGLRRRHQTARGYSVSVSKTLGVGVAALYRAAATPAMRRRWFPSGRFTQSSATPGKYLRGAWNDSARLELGFLSKGAGRAQVAVQVGRLTREAEVETERARWKSGLARLQKLLEG
jgi:hypothetical protein